MKVIRTFKFRCYPTKQQIMKLDSILENSRLMYNKLLEIEKGFLEKGESAILGFDLQHFCDKNKDEFDVMQKKAFDSLPEDVKNKIGNIKHGNL